MKQLIVSAALLFMGTFGVLAAQPAAAVTLKCNGGAVCNEVKNENALNGIIRTVINVLFMIIGIIAVIMIIIGGIRYTTSNGDSNRIAAAKNTIMYAVVGLVVALLSYAIVNFVVAQF